MSTTRVRPTSSPSRFTSRHQLAVFVVATLALSWSSIPFSGGGLLSQGPMLAAFLVLAVVSGRRGVGELWRQMTRWRVRWGWYVVAPGIMVAMHGLALAVSGVVGLGRADGLATPTVPALLGIWSVLLLAGGQWEEPGWLGYLARRLQELATCAPVGVLLVAGLVRMVWHTPLVLSGAIPWYDFVFGTFALQTILLWLYNRTGSVLLPMICHLFSNLALPTFMPLIAESDQRSYWFVFAMVELSVAVGLLLATRGRLGSPPGERTGRASRHLTRTSVR
jgi:membrane protease YdiL (CAAX protease family)